MLKIERLSVNYGSVQALTDFDLEVRGDGVLHGVIGPNGAGKSTLLASAPASFRTSPSVNSSSSSRGISATTNCTT